MLRRCCVLGVTAALFFGSTVHLRPVSAAEDTTTTTAPAPATKLTQKANRSKAKKTKRIKKARRTTSSSGTLTTSSAYGSAAHPVGPVKPLKPVPLTPVDPVPIEMGDGAPLKTFFQALSDLGTPSADAQQPQVVRILHFGDSHVASDYWAGVMREYLQERFGNAGPGFVLPGRPWPTIRYADAKSLDGTGWRTDDLKYGENDGVLGLGGMSLESYKADSPASALADFNQFQLFAASTPGTDCLSVDADGEGLRDLQTRVDVITPSAVVTSEMLVPEPDPRSLGGGAAAPEPPAPATPAQHRRPRRKATPAIPPFRPWPPDTPLNLLEISNAVPLSSGEHRISIRSGCGGSARLLGLELLNGSKGVVYDTDGVNGARLVDLEKPLPPLRKALLKQAHPTLIIVSYGTNDIGAKGFTPSDYEESAFQILSKLKADAGDASILVTGPTDRGSPKKRMRTFIQAAQSELQPALRKAALRAGCAYWDQQAAMGGAGAMARWVRAGLGNFDNVHLTGVGYKKMADLLFAQLMADPVPRPTGPR